MSLLDRWRRSRGRATTALTRPLTPLDPSPEDSVSASHSSLADARTHHDRASLPIESLVGHADSTRGDPSDGGPVSPRTGPLPDSENEALIQQPPATGSSSGGASIQGSAETLPPGVNIDAPSSAGSGAGENQPPAPVSMTGAGPATDRSACGNVTVALRLFEQDDPLAARRRLEAAALAGPIDAAGRELLDLLLPDPAPLPVIEAILRFDDDELSLLERTRWLARRFDSTELTSPQAAEAALDLLAAATMAGGTGWSFVQEAGRRSRVDVALAGPDAQIDLLEQEAFAPGETGLPSTVPGRTLAFGRSMAMRGELEAVRGAERLLHLLREPELAYLMEGERKQRAVGGLSRRRTRQPRSVPAARLTVVLAGGHAPLRRMARRELDELDLADIREFPSAWEGNRQGRHARETIDGSDLTVVIWRQIAHSTSDQVFAAARALSVPVVRAETPTISAIRRAVVDFQAANRR